MALWCVFLFLCSGYSCRNTMDILSLVLSWLELLHLSFKVDRSLHPWVVQFQQLYLRSCRHLLCNFQHTLIHLIFYGLPLSLVLWRMSDILHICSFHCLSLGIHHIRDYSMLWLECLWHLHILYLHRNCLNIVSFLPRLSICWFSVLRMVCMSLLQSCSISWYCIGICLFSSVLVFVTVFFSSSSCFLSPLWVTRGVRKCFRWTDLFYI